MNAETLKALKSSIAHWRRMETGKERPGEMPGIKNCALCSLYMTKDYRCCVGCPVKDKTGETGCTDTPYGDAYKAWFSASEPSTSLRFRDAAKKERLFLESLLPKSATPK